MSSASVADCRLCKAFQGCTETTMAKFTRGRGRLQNAAFPNIHNWGSSGHVNMTQQGSLMLDHLAMLVDEGVS